jgi:hypothetical protein
MARADSARRFCSSVCSNRSHAGNQHHAYNGGLCFSDGRWRVCCRDWTSILYSRAVMAAEIGHLLTPHEIVHHRDENPANDEVSNLQIVTRAEHLALHRAHITEARRAA